MKSILLLVGSWISAAALSPVDWQKGAGQALEPARVTTVPQTWIGVRLTNVPPALAAHVGGDGLMVANVATGSPADQAGVEQFDIIRSINGGAVSDMQDVMKAVERAGQSALKIALVRGGQQQEMELTPAARPAGDISYKFEDPIAPDDATRYFGHRLQRDALGNWVFEPLGQLRGLPQQLDMLQNQQLDPAWRSFTDGWRDMMRDPFRLHVTVDPNDPSSSFLFFEDAAADPDAKMTINISVTEDDVTTSIQRGPDGAIQVTRRDAVGQETSATYASVDELRDKDPEAYALYRRTTGYRPRSWITQPPAMNALPQLQQQWWQELQESLRSADINSNEALRRAQEGFLKAQKDMEDARARARQGGSSSSTTTSTAISVRIADDGSIAVKKRSGGSELEYQFRSREDFQQREPALYEQVRDLLEPAKAAPKKSSQRTPLHSLTRMG